MNATRYSLDSTSQNAGTIISLIQAGGNDVRLFASHPNEQGNGFSDSDGPTTNLPLLSAVVYDHRRWIVFDGLFLTSARPPRSAEVELVLDAAIAEGGVLYGDRPVDFTSGMRPDLAAQYLLSVETRSLTATSRGAYERLLRL